MAYSVGTVAVKPFNELDRKLNGIFYGGHPVKLFIADPYQFRRPVAEIIFEDLILHNASEFRFKAIRGNRQDANSRRIFFLVNLSV
jgi:hypothetical protein